MDCAAVLYLFASLGIIFYDCRCVNYMGSASNLE